MIIKEQFTETEDDRRDSTQSLKQIETLAGYSEFTAGRDSQALVRENKELFLMDTYYKELILKERAAF